MRRQACNLLSVILLAFAVAPLVYAHDSCSDDWNASIIDEAGPAALGDPDAATMVAVEQAANIGDSNAAMLVAAEQEANIGDSNAAMLVAAEQEANIGDSNAAMLVAAEQEANIGEWTLNIEHAATFGDPEDAALACYFGPC